MSGLALMDLTLGSRISYIRAFRGITQKELGLKCGFKPGCADVHIAQYEKNERCPKKDMQEKIAEALDVEPGFLKQYDFSDLNDIFYVYAWIEQMERPLVWKQMSWMYHADTMKYALDKGRITRIKHFDWLFKDKGYIKMPKK